MLYISKRPFFKVCVEKDSKNYFGSKIDVWEELSPKSSHEPT